MALISLVLMGWLAFARNDIVDSIEGHLKAINNDHVTKAYYKYFSQDFQTHTPLVAFQEMISTNPVLKQNKAIRLFDHSIDGHRAIVNGVLASQDDLMVPVEYKLVKEEGRWKISDMHFGMVEEEIAQADKPVTSVPKMSAELLSPIDAQLRAFREDNISQAYYDTVSEQFKKTTSLPDFISFIRRYPILLKHSSVEVRPPVVVDNKVEITVVLNPDKEAIPVNYILVNEGGQWKVWNMIVTPRFWGKAEDLIKNIKTMRKPVEGQLQAFRAQDISKAYDYVSRDFQKTTSLDAFRTFVKQFPILSQHTSAEFKEPSFQQGTGKLEVVLQSPRETAVLEYTLGIEDEQWKVWAVHVRKQSATAASPGPGEAPAKPIQPSPVFSTSASQESETMEKHEEIPLEFIHLDIGSKIDLKGEIVNPTTKLASDVGDLRLNLFVKNASRGTKVEVLLEHMESHSSIPAISTTLQQDGNTVLSFVFSPPPAGWPIGHYQVTATSSTGVRKVFPFSIE